MDTMKSYVDEFIVSPQTREYFLSTTKLSGCGQTLWEWFWSPSFWLPEGMSWKDMQSRPDIKYAVPSDIWIYPILLACTFIILRVYILNPYVIYPIAALVGVKSKLKRVPVANSTIERVYIRWGTDVKQSLIADTAHDAGMTIRQVQVWLRQRKSIDKITKLQKFQDIFILASYHLLISFVLVFTLRYKSWVYDISLCFEDYPHHSMDSGLWWTYITVLSFYWYMSIWQLKYTHGKDTTAQFIHHFSTVVLISFSWTSNMFRIGAMVMLSHEISDLPLLFAKLCLYSERRNLADALFLLFGVLWMGTRVVYFPFWILKACYFDMPQNLMSPAVFVQYVFLFILLILNLLWTFMIIRGLAKKLTTGSNIQDTRSSDDDTDDLENKQN